MEAASETKSDPDGPKEEPDGSPSLAKKLSRMSINANPSPKGKSPIASPKSPTVLSRRTSSSMLRRPDEHSSPRRVLATANASPQHVTPPRSEDKPPMTAASVSKEHFQKELMYHLGSEMQETDTLVLTHDSCYGHRYSRPRTSKTTLSLIVERPERIQAGMLGLASAYVRLGERHAGGAHPPHPHHEPTAKVPFRIRKTSRTVSITSPIVAAVHGAKWMQELKVMCETAGEKLAIGGRELTRPETPTSAGSVPKPQLHEGDLYLCKESLDALEGALGGVCEAVDTVFDDVGEGKSCKKAFVCIRPPGHHCSADWPSGFCWVNNVHIGIEHAIQNHGLTHAAILDFDLHHGDGSQAIAWERNARSLRAQKSTAKNAAFKRSSVGYFSIHDINSYPCEDGDINKVQRASVCIENAHGQNVWNVHLQPWTTEEDFWKLYETQYLVLLEKARAYLRNTTQRLRSTTPNIQPKAAIFLSAGFDASQWETPSMQRHKVNVPTEFYARLTSDVVKMAQEEGLATDGRVISVLEGGYSDRAITSGVFSHLSGLTSSRNMHKPKTEPHAGASDFPTWNPQWWSAAHLQELEDMMRPPAPPPAPSKKLVGPKEVPTYQTPTQSFTAKVVDPTKLQRHTSINMPTPPKSRPPTPPPPEVDWATAACQLSRLLVPSEERQINSCRHEELNEPKKRERHSSIGLPSISLEPVGERRQTRGRKAQQDANTEVDDRRRTISELPVHPEQVDGVSEAKRPPSNAPSGKTSRPPSRVQTKARVPSGGAAGVSIPKTRRASLGKPNVPKPSVEPPPMPQVPQASSNGTVGRDADVDSLTSGMKKITLKLPNPGSTTSTETTAGPKKAAKKPAGQRATKTAVGKAALPSQEDAQSTQPIQRTEPVIKEEHPNAVMNASDNSDKELIGQPPIAFEANNQTGSAPPSVVNHPQREQMQAAEHSMHNPVLSAGAATGATSSAPNDMDLESQEKAVPSDVQPAEPSSAHATDPGVEFVQYEHPAQKQPTDSNFHQEPLQWLPPNTSTPKKQSAGGKENLPTFTATGHIPFHRTDGGSAPNNGRADEEEAETGKGPGQAEEREGKLGHGLNDSVWDVPVTPRQD